MIRKKLFNEGKIYCKRHREGRHPRLWSVQEEDEFGMREYKRKEVVMEMALKVKER